MDGEVMRQKWNRMGEEVLSGMVEWRQQHPQATFREIEAEVDQRLAGLRAKMIADAAISAAERVETAYCPTCGVKLERKGKKKRKLSTRGGQEVELEREYEICPRCGQGIFPPG